MRVEHTVRYAAIVDTLEAAQSFCVDHVGGVGEAVTIHITPLWNYDSEPLTKGGVLHYEVSIEGRDEIMEAG